jgi:hypothetical protein
MRKTFDGRLGGRRQPRGFVEQRGGWRQAAGKQQRLGTREARAMPPQTRAQPLGERLSFAERDVCVHTTARCRQVHAQQNTGAGACLELARLIGQVTPRVEQGERVPPRRRAAQHVPEVSHCLGGFARRSDAPRQAVTDDGLVGGGQELALPDVEGAARVHHVHGGEVAAPGVRIERRLAAKTRVVQKRRQRHAGGVEDQFSRSTPRVGAARPAQRAFIRPARFRKPALAVKRLRQRR